MTLEGVGGLNPNEKRILADGKITAEEAKGLTAAEKNELAQKLAGHENEVEGYQYLLDEPKDSNYEVKFEGFDLGFLSKLAPKWLKNIAKGLIAITPLGLVSCSNQNPPTIVNAQTNINIDINIPINFTEQEKAIASDPEVVALLNKIIDLLKAGLEADQNNYNNLIATLTKQGLDG